MTLESLTVPRPPAAPVLVWSVVGHENTVHGGNRSCDNGEGCGQCSFMAWKCS